MFFLTPGHNWAASVSLHSSALFNEARWAKAVAKLRHLRRQAEPIEVKPVFFSFFSVFFFFLKFFCFCDIFNFWFCFWFYFCFFRGLYLTCFSEAKRFQEVLSIFCETMTHAGFSFHFLSATSVFLSKDLVNSV